MHSQFTLLFEAFAIKVLTACSSVKRAAELLKLDCDTVHSIMSRAVEQGPRRRSMEEVKWNAPIFDPPVMRVRFGLSLSPSLVQSEG
jgi:hypothetical protein